MTIKEIIKANGLNMKQLSDRFGIPYRTIQDWCAEGKGHHEAPEYVVKMIEKILESDLQLNEK